MKAVFRQIVLEILTSRVASANRALWDIYRNHIQDIDHESLPIPLRDKLLEVKQLIIERFEANIDNNHRHNGRATRDEVRRAMLGEHVRTADGWGVSSFADPLNSLPYSTAKKIKEHLFDIYEAL